MPSARPVVSRLAVYGERRVGRDRRPAALAGGRVLEADRVDAGAAGVGRGRAQRDRAAEVRARVVERRGRGGAVDDDVADGRWSSWPTPSVAITRSARLPSAGSVHEAEYGAVVSVPSDDQTPVAQSSLVSVHCANATDGDAAAGVGRSRGDRQRIRRRGVDVLRRRPGR